MKYVFQIITLLFITACSPNLDQQVKDLVEGKNKWIKHVQNSDYSFTYRRNCFCAFREQNVLITVKNNEIISAKIKNDEIRVKSFPTIQKLFESILEGIKTQQDDDKFTIHAQYHPKFGYPTKIRFVRRVMDGSATIFISNVKIHDNK